MTTIDINVTAQAGAAKPEQIKLGRLLRDFQRADITVTRAAEGEPMRLSFPASSETEVERYFGVEVLSHDSKAVRLQRIAGGAAPLLFNHDWSDPVGMVTGGRVKDGRLYVDAQLFDTARAADVAKMIDGGLRNVSIGYEIREMTEDTKKQRFTATDWEPLEVSIVTVPADASVGIGRANDPEPKPVRVVRAEEVSQPAAPAASVRSIAVSDQVNAAAGAADNKQSTRVDVVEDHTNRPDPVTLEKTRKQAIRNLARANQCDDRYVDHWISTGASLEIVADDLLKIQQERGDTASRTYLDMPKKEVQRYSLMRALRAAQNRDWTKAGLELEANKEISKRLSKLPRAETAFFVPLDVMMRDRQPQGFTRDMTSAGVSGSQYLVGTNLMPGSFIELLRNTSVALRMGVRRMSGLVGNVTIPKMTAGNTAYWLADETTQITESQPTIGQLSLAPKNVAALTELSHQLMQQSTPDAEQLVLDSIARDIALAVDVGILRGSGASGQPTGIATTGSIGSVSGTSFYTNAQARILEFQSDVADNNALLDGFGYVTTPTVAANLMNKAELASTGAERLWKGNMSTGSLFGYPSMSSGQMASATMMAGWWPSVILAEWGVLELMTNPYSDFTRGLSAVRGWYTCDVGVRYPGAFSYASSIA